MKFIGLDVGDRRIGVAFGDSMLLLATPVDVIMRASLEEDARMIAGFLRKYDAAQLVVGLPRNMDGTQGAQAESVVRYAERISQAVNVPVVFWDERLTTIEAVERIQAGVPPVPTLRGARRSKKSRRTLDAVAAALILQDFLDSRGSEFP